MSTLRWPTPLTVLALETPHVVAAPTLLNAGKALRALEGQGAWSGHTPNSHTHLPPGSH